MQVKTDKHDIDWICLTCSEQFESFTDIVNHVYTFHDEYIKSEPSYYIMKIHHCKKCNFTTEDNNEFYIHWKIQHN